ncbi:MAG TPA: SDR family oxidoreductase [Actinomycetota bacterium]|nr:SDR family oxidoreductase [Actinomycetota bacterium]
MIDRESRIALVTGASSGIGWATAEALSDRGDRVMAVGRDRDRLAALAEATGAQTIVAYLDEPEECERIVAHTTETLGPVAILVNSAGRGADADRPIWEQSTEDWRATMAINLDAPFLLSRACSRQMREQGWGRIVIVSSTAGEIGAPSMSPYCSSKHGVIGLMRSVAHDLGSFGGTCNAVLPGWVRTRMADVYVRKEAEQRGMSFEEMWRVHDAEYPRGTVVRPEEVAETIAWLTSDGASGVNGHAVTVALGGLW